MNIKKLILLLTVGLTINSAISQQNERGKSKMLDFISKKGVIMKFEEYNLPSIKSGYNSAQTNIRKIIKGNYSKYFFQIKHNSKKASIAAEDLIEIIKAIIELKKQSVTDKDSNSSYLENMFITDDDFKIGYYVSKKKVVWYIELNSKHNGSALFIKDVLKIEEIFKKGKEKIEELKKYKNGTSK